MWHGKVKHPMANSQQDEVNATFQQIHVNNYNHMILDLLKDGENIPEEKMIEGYSQYMNKPPVKKPQVTVKYFK